MRALREVKSWKKGGENGKKSQKFLPEGFQKEGPPKIFQGNLRRMWKGAADGSSFLRKGSSLPRLLQEKVRIPVMPYYVYAIHTDSRLNCFYGSFANYRDAEICGREKRGFDNSQGNSFIALIYAENQTQAADRVKQIRREKGLI